MDGVSFHTDDNVVFNIAELSKKQSIIAEQRICELHELAESAAELVLQMLNEDYSVAEVISFLSDFIQGKKYKPHSALLKDNEVMLDSFMSLVSDYDKACFSTLLSDSLKKRGFEFSESDFLDYANTEETVAFVKSPLSSEAYDVFTEQFSEPRLKYAKDTKEAVAMVVRDEAGYCILPFEERGGVRLSAISEIIFREELKINSVTPVFGPYGGADMKYALLSKNFTLYPVNPGDDRYLEVRLADFSSEAYSLLILASEFFDVGLYRLNTINFATEDGDKKYLSVVFSTESRDFSKLLLYMTLFLSELTPVGIYKNLE